MHVRSYRSNRQSCTSNYFHLLSFFRTPMSTIKFCNLTIMWLNLGRAELDKVCLDMEVSMGLAQGKLSASWSSLSGGITLPLPLPLPLSLLLPFSISLIALCHSLLFRTAHYTTLHNEFYRIGNSMKYNL